MVYQPGIFPYYYYWGALVGEDDGPDVMTDVRRVCSVSGRVKDLHGQYDVRRESRSKLSGGVKGDGQG